jgi:LacI family transcriptional regulator
MKRVGVHEIARLARVSIGTVDRALHARRGISEVTRAKVLRIAEQLGYSPDPAARALAVARSHLRIGICIPEEIHFYYDQMRDGIHDEAKRAAYLGVEAIYRPVPRLGEGEQRQLTKLLNDDIRGLIVMPGNPSVVTPLIGKAEASGIRTICINSDAAQSKRSTVICANPELQGQLAAELLSKFIPGQAEVAVITGMLLTEEHRQKVEGFRARFVQCSPPSANTIVVEAHESEAESYKKTRELLSRNRQLRGIYVTTVNCLPVCRAIWEHGRRDEIKLITTDIFPQMVPFFERGIIGASIYQDPYQQGRTAVRLLVDHLVDKVPICSANYVNPGVILQSNIRQFRELRMSGVNGKVRKQTGAGEARYPRGDKSLAAEARAY